MTFNSIDRIILFQKGTAIPKFLVFKNWEHMQKYENIIRDPLFLLPRNAVRWFLDVVGSKILGVIPECLNCGRFNRANSQCQTCQENSNWVNPFICLVLEKTDPIQVILTDLLSKYKIEVIIKPEKEITQ